MVSSMAQSYCGPTQWNTHSAGSCCCKSSILCSSIRLRHTNRNRGPLEQVIPAEEGLAGSWMEWGRAEPEEMGQADHTWDRVISACMYWISKPSLGLIHLHESRQTCTNLLEMGCFFGRQKNESRVFQDAACRVKFLVILCSSAIDPKPWIQVVMNCLVLFPLGKIDIQPSRAYMDTQISDQLEERAVCLYFLFKHTHLESHVLAA